MFGSEEDEANEDLKQILNAHGQRFLESFDATAFGVKHKGPPEPSRVSSKKREVFNPEGDVEEEWRGFGGLESCIESEARSSDGVGEGRTGGSVGIKRRPDVIVFGTSVATTSISQSVSKAQMKAFMSSKVSNFNKIVAESEKPREDSPDEEADLTNLQNDALLHRLVHTKLLSGSLSPDLDIKPAKRRKALAGRVLEIAGHEKLGQGESSVRAAERNKASKRVRDGMLEKQTERNQKALEEAKNMGSYHPTLKQLLNTSSPRSDKRKREKGLRMGVGSFSGGTLKLSRREVRSITSTDAGDRRGKQKGSKRATRKE